jgi:hypothetical protein
VDKSFTVPDIFANKKDKNITKEMIVVLNGMMSSYAGIIQIRSMGLFSAVRSGSERHP